MWPDPTVHKKPNYLGGTPANKASFLFAGLGSVVFIGCCSLLSYTPWFQKLQEKHLQKGIEHEEKKTGKQMMMDPIVASVVSKRLDEHNRVPDIVKEANHF